MKLISLAAASTCPISRINNFSAVKTIALMDANGSAAVRTEPSFMFFSQEFSDAEFFDIEKVFDHAHVVLGPVSFIEMFHFIAGERVALKAKFYFVGTGYAAI